MRQLQKEAQAGQLVRLSTSECMSKYLKQFQTEAASLFLVSAGDATANHTQVFNVSHVPVFNPTTYIMHWSGTYNATISYNKGDISFSSTDCTVDYPRWICGNTLIAGQPFSIPAKFPYWSDEWEDKPYTSQDLYGYENTADCWIPCSDRLPTADSWAPFGKKVDYCLAQQVEEHCKLQLSVHLSTIVIILNAIKVILMVWVVLQVKESPLMTMGDAVASFLTEADPTTEDMCLLTKKEFRSKEYRFQKMFKKGPRPFSEKRHRWGSAVSRVRWAICMAL